MAETYINQEECDEIKENLVLHERNGNVFICRIASKDQ